MEKLKGRPEKASADLRLSDLGISHNQSSQCQKLAARFRFQSQSAGGGSSSGRLQKAKNLQLVVYWSSSARENLVSEQLEVAIVGGGIGGLAAALALRTRGLRVTIFEQAGELREIGAGVSIFPNATLLLQRIGLADGLAKIVSPITGLVLRTSLGEHINALAPPSTAVQSYNVHRADFLKLLADALPEGTLHLGHQLLGARETDGRAHLIFSNGATVNSDIVIGADGIHSTVQREIGLKSYPSSEGIMAYRGLVPTERLSWAKNIGGGMSRWIGKGRSFLCYPVSSGRLMNMVAFVPTDLESEESWTAPGDLRALRAEYAGWDDPVQETISALDRTFRWAYMTVRLCHAGRRIG